MGSLLRIFDRIIHQIDDHLHDQPGIHSGQKQFVLMLNRDRVFIFFPVYMAKCLLDHIINQTATRILELTGNTLVNYIGNYDYYLEKKDELTKIYVPSATEEETASLPSSSAETAGKLTWQQQKEEQARIRKRQNELKKTEDRIHVLEVRDKEIDELMMQEEVFTNVAKCVELNKEKTAVNEELEQLYEHWEELAE